VKSKGAFAVVLGDSNDTVPTPEFNDLTERQGSLTIKEFTGRINVSGIFKDGTVEI